MSTITVGLDGSPESLAAADWAAREAVERDALLRLLHGGEQMRYLYAPLAGVPAPNALDAQREWAAYMLRETEARLVRRHPGLRITTQQTEEQAVPALLAAADDLLVLGSRGLGTLAGFLVGSVALAVVARSPRPVVLVRADGSAADEQRPDATRTGSTMGPHRDVVLGLDLEDPEDTGIGFAFEAARRHAADLRVVHGWSPPAAYGYGAAMDAGVNDEPAEQVRHRLADVLRPWKDKYPGVEVREQAVVGGAGRHLVHASRDAALVVVGRKNRRSPVGGRIGPVTHAALQHASAPVAVVPHD
ncbi:universal stress protein [Streptomyces collinus]|uniref:universal stress protein n=1 Tax=Streptomyces collinus TaxID=42684 RepID=UPI00382E3DC6